jgi:hypothetical protein
MAEVDLDAVPEDAASVMDEPLHLRWYGAEGSLPSPAYTGDNNGGRVPGSGIAAGTVGEPRLHFQGWNNVWGVGRDQDLASVFGGTRVWSDRSPIGG